MGRKRRSERLGGDVEADSPIVVGLGKVSNFDCFTTKRKHRTFERGRTSEPERSREGDRKQRRNVRYQTRFVSHGRQKFHTCGMQLLCSMVAAGGTVSGTTTSLELCCPWATNPYLGQYGNRPASCHPSSRDSLRYPSPAHASFNYVAGVMLTWSQWLECDWNELVFFRRPKWKRYHPSNGGRLETLPPTDILSGVLGAAKLGD